MASANTSNQTSPVLPSTPQGSTNEAPIEAPQERTIVDLSPPMNNQSAPTMPNESKATDYIPTWTKTYSPNISFSDSSHGIVNLGTDDCIITIDVRSVVYKTEPLEEIINSEFKSY
tara:strand:+ start:388 stop:735 length:348 start_codon:yes stop_codon:yes gene_type:complete